MLHFNGQYFVLAPNKIVLTSIFLIKSAQFDFYLNMIWRILVALNMRTGHNIVLLTVL